VPPDSIEPDALKDTRDAFLDALPTSHFLLLRQLESMTQVGDYIFVHAGVRPGVALRRQKRDDLLWIREEFLDHPRPATGVVVHGHTWTTDQPVVMSNRIGLDTGAYETGVLTALRISTDELLFLQAVDTLASGAGGRAGRAEESQTAATQIG
jgi:serine/threonine protein phosphatase 1